ncbi:Tyrosine recombinase XerC [subsurface metagenome]
MAKELTTKKDSNVLTLQERFPTITIFEGLKKASSVFDSIKSFEDVEHVLLKGAGLQPNTYRIYLGAVKRFWEHTDGIHPLQVLPAHIEEFYDARIKEVEKNTVYLEIQALKKFFVGIRKVIPVYTSPFELMGDGLKKKLNRTRRGNRTKKALSLNEMNLLLERLRVDPTVKGKGDYAIVFMLMSSGLRADELCQLKWKNLELFEGTWKCYFTGKGGTDAEQELFAPAVEVCREYFKAAFKRSPRKEDALFWTVPRAKSEDPVPLNYHALWYRVKKIGEMVKREGIIKRDLTWSAHLFRRSYASGLYRKGMKIKAIQEKTRHKSIDVLINHYIDDSEPASPYLAEMFA